MELRADLHIHSKYSRATSRAMDIPHLTSAAATKGIDLLGTGDFTHPAWRSELKSWLEETPYEGVYEYGGVYFILQTEVNLAFRRGDRLHRIHLVVLAPDFEVAEEASTLMSRWGNLEADGRPTLSVEPPEFLEAILEIDPWVEVIPAHVWTPWYSLFGSRSGFDSVEEAFQDQSHRIHALETGLSSDPPMNWRLSSLDRYALVSFSDAHSANSLRLGRELTAFSVKEPSYREIVRALREPSHAALAYTVEVPPEYGKYHYDGHRSCGVRMHPKEAIRRGNTCPICGRQLTLGVLHRVEELADRPEGAISANARPFYRLIPLREILTLAKEEGRLSEKPDVVYRKLVEEFGSEMRVLLSRNYQTLERLAGETVAGVLRAMHSGDLLIDPGYDGVYGRLLLDSGSRELNRFREFGDLTEFLS